jgi:hypothetical protein
MAVIARGEFEPLLHYHNAIDNKSRKTTTTVPTPTIKPYSRTQLSPAIILEIMVEIESVADEQQTQSPNNMEWQDLMGQDLRLKVRKQTRK